MGWNQDLNRQLNQDLKSFFRQANRYDSRHCLIRYFHLRPLR